MGFDLRSLAWRKQLPDCRDGKIGFFNQCHQFDAKLAHFIRRLRTVPASADFCEFSGKQRRKAATKTKRGMILTMLALDGIILNPVARSTSSVSRRASTSSLRSAVDRARA